MFFFVGLWKTVNASSSSTSITSFFIDYKGLPNSVLRIIEKVATVESSYLKELIHEILAKRFY